jgi:FKBP-type peptidyl-prolyl cis-trans isomerase
MKYISFAIVIIFICVVVGFWLKGAPKTETSAPISSEVKTGESTPIQETPTTTDNKKNKITMIQGMKIETTKEGSGPEIKNGQTAVVHYTGKLTDGKVFDSSKTRGTPFEFPLGAGMVIKGWELGVLGMKVGETRMLTIPAELGYGANGAGGVIPPNATLIFEVELLGIK